MSKRSTTNLPKIIVITGPTASGKSDVAVRLAKKYNGEIVSADSRQVYRGLDAGTGKITKKEMRGVTHHLLDVTNPKREFSVAQYRMLAKKALESIGNRGRIPFLVGGTGFYIDAVLGRVTFPEIPPNQPLRDQLEKKSTESLVNVLEKLDPKRAVTIDRHNRVRLVRAIEIAKTIGSVPTVTTTKNYDSLEIGIQTPDEHLKERITLRLKKRMPKIITEVRTLHNKGLSWKRMYRLGLEYRFVSQYLQEKYTREEMTELLTTAIWQYARRQKTWFKKNKHILWFSLSNEKQVEKKVAQFLANK
jgi:tRNA dimethylallyltransferase